VVFSDPPLGSSLIPIDLPLDLLSLGWIWRFPAIHQPLDCRCWQHSVPVSVLREEKLMAVVGDQEPERGRLLLLHSGDQVEDRTVALE
jgi:hypothetical protein